jgi:hypothetical protein
MKAKREPKQRAISAERAERELNALNRLYNAGMLTARQHKSRYDALLAKIAVE